MVKRALACAVVGACLSGCPIAPDNFGDAGTDAGVDAGTPADAGVDGGTPASGTVSCAISASGPLGSSGTSTFAWSGADLAGSTSSFDGTSYTVDVIASNAASGAFGFELAGLTVGAPSGYQLNVMEWQAPSGFALSDTWTCGATSACIAQVIVSAFDGTSISGTFSAQFFAGSSQSGSNSASVNGGTFTVVLPH
ncbi:MAG TPA: hypothetical protein VMB50_02645 [Myxococcales bacterium]|nr:hypothetical protein [Myxococcales bacterium]